MHTLLYLPHHIVCLPSENSICNFFQLYVNVWIFFPQLFRRCYSINNTTVLGCPRDVWKSEWGKWRKSKKKNCWPLWCWFVLKDRGMRAFLHGVFAIVFFLQRLTMAPHHEDLSFPAFPFSFSQFFRLSPWNQSYVSDSLSFLPTPPPGQQLSKWRRFLFYATPLAPQGGRESREFIHPHTIFLFTVFSLLWHTRVPFQYLFCYKGSSWIFCDRIVSTLW